MEAQADHLMAHLPFLRRYARALAGSTEKGDMLVAQVVESTLSEPARYGLDREPAAATRLPLYALLNRAADETEPEDRALPAGDAVHPAVHPIESALARLPEEQRRLYLLVRLEELSVVQAAEVMGIPHEAARAALASSQDAMRERLVANILIVEDDAIIAYDLSETVLSMGHRVAGTAASMEEALETAARTQPTLALMDLRLAHGGSGIATAQALREKSSLPIIFVTAFAEELRRRGLDHLGPVIRKPFTRDQIERAITQAVFMPRPG
jgi:CheY-like chemotaxis protein